MVPTSDPTETVREFATRFSDGEIVDAVDVLTETGCEAVVDSFPEAFQRGPMDAEDTLKQYRRGLFSQYGPTVEVGSVDVAGTEATAEFVFEDGTETATLGVDDEGVTDLAFEPAYEVPAYVDERAFSERPVTVDAGSVSLDGILTMPDGDGPFPGVVLVHGAGIHDPDGTAGASKVLKDLAWGLASEGIATLRYEKRLAEHEITDEDRTLDTVVVDDAVAAVDELAATTAVDGDAVFVTGHSQGGMAAPRIADRHSSVAGVAVLDGRADSMHDPEDLTFLRYEFEPDGNLTEEQEAELERDRETVRRLAEGDFDDDEMLWGLPGVWHRSLRNYDPAGTASRLDAPVFVAKTCRADEATQADLAAWFRTEFEAWQATDLPDGSCVTFYEGLDHYLQKGFAPAHPLGLYFGGNVAADVVSDLVTWVYHATSSSTT